MSHDDLVILGRVGGALLIGALIGFERSFHGRPAGFRTHSLVCLASALLMIITVYQDDWMTHVAHDAIRTDPTRMAQGIMTGIGFLGAGHEFSIDNLSSCAIEGGKAFEYRMTLRSGDLKNAEALSQHLRRTSQVVEFSIAPTGG